jgi:hypothetical protein
MSKTREGSKEERRNSRDHCPEHARLDEQPHDGGDHDHDQGDEQVAAQAAQVAVCDVPDG